MISTNLFFVVSVLLLFWHGLVFGWNSNVWYTQGTNQLEKRNCKKFGEKWQTTHQSLYAIHSSSEFCTAGDRLLKWPEKFIWRFVKKLLSRENSDKIWNAKKLFHEQGEYDKSFLILFAFHIFFKFSHFLRGSLRIVYSWQKRIFVEKYRWWSRYIIFVKSNDK